MLGKEKKKEPPPFSYNQYFINKIIIITFPRQHKLICIVCNSALAHGRAVHERFISLCVSVVDESS